MARPCKEGLDYFPHDVDSANDEKIETLCAVYGHHEGYSTYYRLLERIYRAGGKLNISVTEIRQKLARNCGHMTDDQFQKFLNTCCNIELFDKSQYEQGFITSNGIQKRIAPVILKRHRAKELYEKSVTETTQKPLISVTENPPETTQSKVKYSKEKNIKTKTGVCVDDSRFNDPLPLDHENAYQWFREYYQARTKKAVLEVAGRKAFSANIKNLPEIIEFKRAIEKYFQKDLDALKGFAYGPEKLLWNWRTYIPTQAEIEALEAREAAKRAEIEADRVEQRTCTCGVTYKTTKGDDFKACPACRERTRKEAIKKAGDLVRGLSEKFKA